VKLEDLKAATGQELTVGSARIKLKSREWLGSPNSRRRMISAEISEASLGGGLRVLAETLHLPALPECFEPANSIKLLNFVAGVEEILEGDRITKTEVILVGFGLELAGEWRVIEHFLSVSNLKADFSIASPQDDQLREIDISLGGLLRFADAAIEITATARHRTALPQTPEKALEALKDLGLNFDDEDQTNFKDWLAAKRESAGRLDFEIEGELPKGQSISIADVARHFGFAIDEHQSSFAALKVDKLQMRASTATGSFAFLMELGSNSGKAAYLLSEELKLQDLILSVEGSTDSGLAGSLSCSVAIGGVLVHLQADWGSAGGGWVFEGDVEVEPEKLNEMLADLGRKLGFTVPDPGLKNRGGKDHPQPIAIRFLFNTGTREINLSLRAALEVAGNDYTTRMDIAILPDDKSGWSVKFSGALDFGKPGEDPMRFELAVDHSAAGDTVIATYADEGSHDLVALASRLTGQNLPKAVAVSIGGAVFARRTKPELNLLAFNIKGKLDIGEIKIPGLALVSDSAAAGISAHLQFQLALSNQELAEKDPLYAAIAAQGFSLIPGGVKTPMTFGAQIQLGEETHTLAVPANAQETALGKDLDRRVANNGAGPAPLDGPAPGSGHWIELHRKLGPLRLERIGIRFDTEPAVQVALLLDAGFEFAGLQVALNGLEMRSPLDKFEATFGLAGLAIGYRNPAIEISGALLHYVAEDRQGFSGAAIVRTQTFCLTAVGDFSNIDGHPSLFVYSVLDYALGGPPFFFVTGLAAGLGYNRDIVLPEAEAVEKYPLVEWATGKVSRPSDPLQALRKLEDSMPPAVGTAFVAIGVSFTSFKLMNSFALLVAKFGSRFELDLVGSSILATPPGEQKLPLAQATLGLRARFVPEEGTLYVRAVLGADSFVLSRACHLGGGFAFAAWFKDQTGSGGNRIVAGDFVVTLGGYHPDFRGDPDRYPHYPSVPRVSLDWAIDRHLSFKGSAYFALTAGVVMAGGRFEALWQSEDLRVSFIATADFLLTFKPYHYDITVGISIAIDFTCHVFGTHHLTFDAGADLHLWGPEFGGSAHLHLHVIAIEVAFDAEFGSERSLPVALTWTEFRESLVPKEAFSFSAQGGLLEPAGQDSRNLGVFCAHDLALAVETAIPLSQISFGDFKFPSPNRPAVAPAGFVDSEFTSEFEIKLSRRDEDQDARASHALTASSSEKKDDYHVLNVKSHDGFAADLIFAPVHKPMPAGIWGEPHLEQGPDNRRYLKKPQLQDAHSMFTRPMLTGFTIKVKNGRREQAQAHPAKTGDKKTRTIKLKAPPKVPDAAIASPEREEMLRYLGLQIPAAA
jgi:hypothetical protein